MPVTGVPATSVDPVASLVSALGGATTAATAAAAAATSAASALSSRQVIAGTGLTGGGTLAADRTFAVDFASSGVSSSTKAVKADDSRLLVRPGPFGSLMAALDNGRSCALQVLGDSTGATTARWPYLVASWLAAQYPTYMVNVPQWNDATQAYDGATVTQTGPSGAPYALMNGGNGILHLRDGVQFTADIDIRVKVSIPSYPSGVDPYLLLCDGTGNRMLRFQLLRSGANQGKLFYAYSTDGTVLVNNQSTAAAPWVFGTPLWVRVTHTFNNGSSGTDVKFYTSTDYDPVSATAGTWTQLGTTITNSGAIASLYNPTAATYWSAGNSMPSGTKFYWFEIRNGIGGLCTTQGPGDTWPDFDGNATFGGSPIFTVVNGSKVGANIAYLNNSTRLPKMLLSDYGTRAIIVSDSHNDSTRFGDEYLVDWDALLTQIRAKMAYTPLAVTLQNPRSSPATQIECHARRRLNQIAWAAKNAVPTIDVYRAFVDSGTALASLNNSDGIHPSDASGSPLWASTVEAAILGRS